jgi:hypothetical protein
MWLGRGVRAAGVCGVRAAAPAVPGQPVAGGGRGMPPAGSIGRREPRQGALARGGGQARLARAAAAPAAAARARRAHPARPMRPVPRPRGVPARLWAAVAPVGGGAAGMGPRKRVGFQASLNLAAAAQSSRLPRPPPKTYKKYPSSPHPHHPPPPPPTTPPTPTTTPAVDHHGRQPLLPADPAREQRPAVRIEDSRPRRAGEGAGGARVAGPGGGRQRGGPRVVDTQPPGAGAP